MQLATSQHNSSQPSSQPSSQLSSQVKLSCMTAQAKNALPYLIAKYMHDNEADIISNCDALIEAMTEGKQLVIDDIVDAFIYVIPLFNNKLTLVEQDNPSFKRIIYEHLVDQGMEPNLTKRHLVAACCCNTMLNSISVNKNTHSGNDYMRSYAPLVLRAYLIFYKLKAVANY